MLRLREQRTLDPSLVLWLPLRDMPDGNSLQSFDAHGHPCTVYGATWGAQGRYFDGSDDYIERASPPVVLQNLLAFSVMAWCKPSTIAGNKDVICRNYYVVGGFSLRTSQNDGRFNVVYRDNGGTQQFVDGTFLSAGNWAMLVCTRLGTDMRTYVNGKQTNSTVTATSPASGTGSILIGQNTDSIFWDGVIGEVRIYNRALRPLEIARIYESTKGRYTP